MNTKTGSREMASSVLSGLIFCVLGSTLAGLASAGILIGVVLVLT